MMISNERQRNPRFREDDTRESNWSELPGELLGEILRRLNFIDAARAKCVCSHWSSIWVSPSSDNLTTPWLLIPPRGGHIDRITKGVTHLYNPVDGHLHRTKTLLDEFEWSSSHLLIGSSHGFLIGLTKYESSVVLFVWNPLTGTRIDLPRVDHLMNFEWDDRNKAILTSAPVGRSGCVAALVLLYKFDKLAACTCTPHDHSSSSSSLWTELDVDSGLSCYYDVSSAGGKIFAVGYPSSVEIWSSNPPFEKITTMKPPRLRRQRRCPLTKKVLCLQIYIVMPLLVKRFVSRKNRKTVWFEVFRMDDEKEKWVKAESLGENRALFLGGGSHSVSVSAAAGTGVEADCIYYTANDWYLSKQGGPDVGVFSLRQRRIIKELTGGEFGVMNNEWECDSSLHWLVPTPW